MISDSINYVLCVFLAAFMAFAGFAQGGDLYQSGQTRLKEGKFAEARQDFEAALKDAKTGSEKAEAQIGIGLVYEAEKKGAETRVEFEKALAIEGITPEQTGQTLVKIGAALINDKKVQDGIVALDKARALKGISNQTRIQANLLYGQTYLAYPWVLQQAADAFTQIMDLPEITPGQKLAARKGLAQALMGLKKYSDARAVMKEIIASKELPEAEKPATQISIGTTCMLEGKFEEARTELARALSMEGVTDDDKVHIQLQIGLSYYDAGDLERARPELEKVLTMPRANAHQARNNGWDPYIPAREANLRLKKLAPAGSREKTINVLFIGSSMTIRGWMPFKVEELSASAPTGMPRIVSANYIRGGTKIDVFWNDGDTRDTARARIASFPWDFVVLETFYTMKLEDLLKYGKLFGDFARSKNIKPVFYESQVAQAQPFPDSFRKFHADNMELKKSVNAPLAPVVLAELHYLEANPAAKLGLFYADWIHPSETGMYLASCCLYSAITGQSPVGLAHPKEISDEDAGKLQEAAWKAVREANPELKPLE
jgi:tetratricopeptide (TPR) repeat protein